MFHDFRYPAILAASTRAAWQIDDVIGPGAELDFSRPFMPENPDADKHCNDFNSAAFKYVAAHTPDSVFMVGTKAAPSSPDEELVYGFEQSVTNFNDLGIQVVAIRDNPRYDHNVTECALSKGVDSPDCKSDLHDVLAAESPFASVQGKFGNAAFLDMTDLLCNGVQCPSVIGNVFVYLDDNHLSKTYVTSMGEMFDERWFAATGWER